MSASTCKGEHDADLSVRSSRKQLNVDSPSFTPLAPSTNGLTAGSSPRAAAISPRSASAAVFTPKTTKGATSTPATQSRDQSAEWQPPQDFQEFVPQQHTFELPQVQVQDQSQLQGLVQNFDPFSAQAASGAVAAGHQTAQVNPYAQDASSLSHSQYFAGAGGYQQPLQYHLYAPSGPSHQNLLDYQRKAYDFFIPEDLREDLQRKAEATQQTLPQSGLPAQVEVFHSLVPLDTSHQKNTTLFGYNSWLYKAVSSQDGRTYAIRRLEGYRLTDERGVQALRHWNRVRNGGVVSIHQVMTTRAFGDSSLIFVMDYHPLAKTLAEQHFQNSPARFSGPRNQSPHIEESELWSYVVQIASALKAIHSERLAARVISPSKVILTSKRRIRLSACGVQDVAQYSPTQQAADFQQEDFVQFGQLMLGLAINNATPMQNYPKSVEALSRSHYTQRLKDCVQWLLLPSPSTGTPLTPTSAGASPSAKNIDYFLTEIAVQVTLSLDESLHADDTLTSHLSRELENGRIVRLLTKLNMINERPDTFAAGHTNADNQWSETGERYYLKLFRDYVFHQVDERGRPVTDLGWVIGCLNRLDAGSEEKIMLTSRDEQTVLIVTYRDVRRGLESAWQDVLKAQGRR